MTFIAENTFLWQKLAVQLSVNVTLDNAIQLLQQGVKILYIQFGLHTREENEHLLDMANQAIGTYALEMDLRKPAIGVACELSGRSCRLKYGRKWGPVEVTPGQRIYLTSDAKYEDKKSDSIIFVTNFEKLLTTLIPGDVLNINEMQLKVCKINGKYMQCCIINDSSSLCMFYPYDQIENISTDKSTKLSNINAQECLLALKKGCRYIVIPDVENHTMIHAVDELLQFNLKGDQTIRTIARLVTSASDNPCIKHNIQHVAGCVTQDADVVRQCKELCKAVLFEVSDIDQLPKEEIFRHVDVFITKPEIIEALKFRLRELNQTAMSTLKPSVYPLQLEQGQRVLCQCIEYASNNCKANAVIFCTPKSLCEAEKLSRRSLPCPVLVTTEDEDALYYLLLRKYCFPVFVCGAKSNRQLIKYATIYGRKFGFLKPGNFIVSGFGEHLVQGLEMRYVPDDFIVGAQ
ncbi:uncharacterized protein LOC109401780 isoform X2 [Aedes albopictus]|uniref:Pyruvate kinase n=1 Tax=Aedes albopictus TaxID=7160 RepID=A0ABM1YZJ7_AEDAL